MSGPVLGGQSREVFGAGSLGRALPASSFFLEQQQALGWGAGRKVVTLLQKHLVFLLYSYSFVFLLNICIQQINEGHCPLHSPSLLK